MSRKFGNIAACVLILIVSIGFMFFWWLGAYGDGYLPQWVKQGNTLVEAVEAYKKKHGAYPEVLPITVDKKEIPGCKSVLYDKFQADDGSEYYVIRMLIHLREVVMYDSRKNLDESKSWGVHQIMNDWMWTKD